MSKKTPLPPVLEELLDSLGGPPTDAYLVEVETAAKHMAAGQGTSSGGSKGAARSAETRRGPESKYAAILVAAAAYAGPDSAKVATIVRTLARQGTRVDESYVRRILRNSGR